jgi:hypothetical protein
MKHLYEIYYQDYKSSLNDICLGIFELEIKPFVGSSKQPISKYLSKIKLIIGDTPIIFRVKEKFTMFGFNQIILNIQMWDELIPKTSRDAIVKIDLEDCDIIIYKLNDD